MKLVNENLKEFLNEAQKEMFYIVRTDSEMDRYGISNKEGEIIWESSRKDITTFLLRNGGVSNSFEVKNLLLKADKFGGNPMVSGETIIKKGSFGKKTEIGKGAKVLGAPIFLRPFMIDRELSKGDNEASRKTPEQVTKKQTREFDKMDREAKAERDSRFGIDPATRRRMEREERDAVLIRQGKKPAKTPIIKKTPIEKEEPEIEIEPEQTYGASKLRREENEKPFIKKRRQRI